MSIFAKRFSQAGIKLIFVKIAPKAHKFLVPQVRAKYACYVGASKEKSLSLFQVKNAIKYFLQRLFGYQRYLNIFSRFKIWTLKWDKNEADFFVFLESIENKKGIILDVGANIGIMTAHLSKRFPNNHILAIEPMPDNLIVLEDLSQKQNWNNVRILPFAVGAEEGEATMILPNHGQTKMQGLSHIKCDEIQEWNEGQEFQVKLKTLDSLISEEPVLAIKMDVENYEYQALLGAENILRKDKPLLYLELWDNENRKKCFEFLTELNYSIQVVVQGKRTAFNPSIHAHQNFLFQPN